MDIKKIKMESKQFIQSAGNQALQNLGTGKPEKGMQSADNNEGNAASPAKDAKNVLLEPININESSLTPMKTEAEPQTRQIHKKSMKKVLQPLHKQLFKPKALSQNLRNDAQNSLEWTLYRKRHCLSKKTRIFICKGYGSFKKALFERGWHENTDFNSTVFHLKFVVKRDHIFSKGIGRPNIGSYDGAGGELLDFQIVNHFSNNNLLTSKVGLCASLKNLVLWTNNTMENFFPKCFTITKS